MASAEAWLPMWSPSARSAMEPKASPAPISTVIVRIVTMLTTSVRLSADFLWSCPKVWSCIHRSTDSVCISLSLDTKIGNPAAIRIPFSYSDSSIIPPGRHELEIIIVRIGEGRDHPFRVFRRIVRLRDDRGPEFLDSFEFSLYFLCLEIEHYPFGVR